MNLTLYSIAIGTFIWGCTFSQVQPIHKLVESSAPRSVEFDSFNGEEVLKCLPIFWSVNATIVNVLPASR